MKWWMTGRMQHMALLTGALGLLTACGGGQSEPQVAPTEPSPSEEEELSAEEAEALAMIEADSEAMEAEDAGTPAEAQGKDAPRDITYRMSQEGLAVEVGGATFVPKATGKKVKGGWGVELTVEATSTTPAVLFAPNGNPLAFSAKVTRRSGKIETLGDARQDGSELTLGPESPQTFSRVWPPADIAPLAAGDSLELAVGLWGYGTSSEDRRPLKRFVFVAMKADSTGVQPLVQPPPQ